MPCVADRPVGIEDFAGPDALPDDARALFGGDAFSTLAWYRSVAQAALGPGEQACFQVVRCDRQVVGVLPMRHGARGYASLSTPYTALWSPLWRAELAPSAIEAAGRALGRVWRGFACTRLDALDADAAWLPPLMRGVGRAGLLPLRFDHFGNWRLEVAGLGWDAYLAGRPGELRTAIARRSRRLMQGLGARFTLVDGADGLEAGIDAYARVYAASWKPAEPFADFSAVLMRQAAAAGYLRLGVLSLGGAPIAVQLWLLHDGWAGVQKLAHDEAHRSLAPGTVLTALVIRHLLACDGVGVLDFGRGDDAYKRLWTGDRRQRVGVVLAAGWRAGGARAVGRHLGGWVRRKLGAASPGGAGTGLGEAPAVQQERGRADD